MKIYGEKNDIPNVSLTNARFLRDLLKIKKPKRVLEVGTANGFSAINMGIELEKWSGSLDTIEFSENSFNVAKKNIEVAGLVGTIQQHLGNALDILPQLQSGYEFVFIDGMKRRTKDFFNLAYPLLDEGGVMIIDDVILFRDKMLGLQEMLDEKNIVYNVIPIDVNDGVIMLVK